MALIPPLSLSNPTLGFKLDPGEPGNLRSAPASQSTLRVTAQERRNLGRLRRRASLEGRIPIQSGATFTRALPGTAVGTVIAGRTTVTSIPDRTGLPTGPPVPGERLVARLVAEILPPGTPGPVEALAEAIAPDTSTAPGAEPESDDEPLAGLFGEATGLAALLAATPGEDEGDGPDGAAEAQQGAAAGEGAARSRALRFERDSLVFDRARITQAAAAAETPEEAAAAREDIQPVRSRLREIEGELRQAEAQRIREGLRSDDDEPTGFQSRAPARPSAPGQADEPRSRFDRVA